MTGSDAGRSRDQHGADSPFTPTYGSTDPFGPRSSASDPGGGPSGGSGGGRAGLVVGALLVVVVALVVAAGVVAWRLVQQSGGDDARPTADAPASSATAPAEGTTPSTTTSASPRTASPAPAPTGPWQPVTSAKDAMTYDVPPDWTPAPDALAGYESSKGEVQALAHAVASSGDDWCDNGSHHTLVGFVTPGSISDQGTIADTAAHWAKWAGSDEHDTLATGSVGAPHAVKVAGGRITATEVTATATPAPHRCAAPSLEVTVVSVPKPAGGTALFVVVADRNTDGAVPEATLAKVIASLRPAS